MQPSILVLIISCHFPVSSLWQISAKSSAVSWIILGCVNLYNFIHVFCATRSAHSTISIHQGSYHSFKKQLIPNRRTNRQLLWNSSVLLNGELPYGFALRINLINLSSPADPEHLKGRGDLIHMSPLCTCISCHSTNICETKEEAACH